MVTCISSRKTEFNIFKKITTTSSSCKVGPAGDWLT
ncbi:unnamed protein product [Tenebrio molitor]|nr:unnamed protein product [Tenebrio molitor]